MHQKYCCVFAVLIMVTGACLTSAVAQTSFELDFSGAVVTDTVDEGGSAPYSGSLRIEVEDIVVGGGADIDLLIESVDTYFPRQSNPANGLANNGTPAGTDDLRIHLGVDQETQFRFSLYDGSSNFTQLYTSPSEFKFSMVSYDLDGISSAGGGADYLTIEADNFAYGLSASTSVNVINNSPTSATFHADGVGEVPGQAGIQDFVSGDGPAQLPVSVYLEFTNVNQFFFTYSVPNTGNGSGRNLLMDGNDIQYADFMNSNPLIVIPEPSTLIMVGLAVVLTMSLLLRKR